MDGFEQVLRTYDVPQVLHNLDEAENCGNPAVRHYLFGPKSAVV